MKYRSKLLALIVIGGAIGYSIASDRMSPAAGQTSQTEDPEYIHPSIRDYGKVVQLADATQQPRNGSKIAVDITKGGDFDKLNPAIEKVCRYVNIYAGAGKEAATVDIAVVLHGDATLAILSNDAYSNRFNTNGNPNLACLRELDQAGVKIYVCGQSLIGKNAKPAEVSEHAEVAVSALTSLVNLQSEGYAYIPMLK